MVDRTRAIGWREVLLVAVVAVLAVLAVDALARVMPPVATFFQSTPIVVVFLIAATGLVLWRIAARRPPEP